MTPIVWTNLGYLALAIPLTVWVAHTLHKNGRIFLVDTFLGNQPLADSVNHLLVVGFYLVNLGFICFALKSTDRPADLQGILELLSSKIGLVLLILGGMHFFNIALFTKLRRRAVEKNVPPLVPAHPLRPLRP